MIEEGILIPSTLRPVGQGQTGAKRGQVKIGGVSQKCVVKPETVQGIVAECFAAAVGMHLSLPTLRPVIVRYPGKAEFWFGAREVQHPSLLTALNVGVNDAAGVRRAALLLATWAQFGSSIAFDELIANPDRNLQNLLWDGADFWLIDHANALGTRTHDLNKLAAMALSLDQTTIDATKAAAIAQALVQQTRCGPGQQVWQDIQSALQSLSLMQASYSTWAQQAEACMAFVHARLPMLASDTANCFSPLLKSHAIA